MYRQPSPVFHLVTGKAYTLRRICAIKARRVRSRLSAALPNSPVMPVSLSTMSRAEPAGFSQIYPMAPECFPDTFSE
jgi:hypothetical protein